MTVRWAFLLIWLGVGLMCFVAAALMVRRQRRIGVGPTAAVRELAGKDNVVRPPMSSPHQAAS